MKEEDIIRAQFLMSPYNVKEAKRVKQMRRAIIQVGLTIIVLTILGAVFAFLQR